MSWKKHRYDDIPGTYVFDGRTSHAAYALNKMLFSFNQQESREEFNLDPGAYAVKFGLTDKQQKALLDNDYLELIRLGANVYYLAKLTIPRGVSIQDAGAAFQGITTEEFKAKLTSKGKDLKEKLEQAGGFWNG